MTCFKYHKILEVSESGNVITTSDMTVSDLCKLDKLEPGTMLVLENDRKIWIGDCTPFEEPGNCGGGWDWKKWDSFKVKAVHKFHN